jgi:hypothetical protein
MNKKVKAAPAEENVWDDSTADTIDVTAEDIVAVAEQVAATAPKSTSNADYDLEGLMTDFPTAKDLERFVFDETGIVLNLKGRANKLKYQIAMDTLNGVEVDSKFIGGDNPYVEKSELVPEEPLKAKPTRDKTLPPQTQIQNTFYTPMVPHPDPDARAEDKKVHVMFRKYNNGQISYEILGPLELKPHGNKIDKYGRERPEIMKWIDPRTGEQTAVREDGTLTPQGKRLRAMMQSAKFRVNNSTQWDTFVDREFASLTNEAAHNPWDDGL